MLSYLGSGTSAYYNRLLKEKLDANRAADRAKSKADRVQKKYKYFCPHCLFQTNEYSKICPKCRRGRLEKTIARRFIRTPKRRKRSIFE